MIARQQISTQPIPIGWEYVSEKVWNSAGSKYMYGKVNSRDIFYVSIIYITIRCSICFVFFLWLWWWPKTCMEDHQGQFLQQSNNNNITFTFSITVPYCIGLDWVIWNTLHCLQLPPNLALWLTKPWIENIEWKCRLKTNLTHVIIAISPSRWPKTSKRTCFSMMERSPTIATSVATQASVLLMWESTCWFTVERSLSFAHSANTPAQQLVTSRGTC